MEPFYFGPSERRLFGVYHPPDFGSDRGVGVVLCHPVGQEYIRSHRAFLQLAIRLSGAGFHTLRFDFSDCGDSAYTPGHGEVAQWVDDATTALDELREGSGAERLCLIGLRLGGSVAMVTAAREGGVEGLVVWDGVIDGRSYLEELRAQHEEWWQYSSIVRMRPPRSEAVVEEVLGFPLSANLAASLEGLDLLQVDASPAKRALVIDTRREDSSAPLSRHLRSLGTDEEVRYLQAPSVWMKQRGELGDCVVPGPVLDALVDWMDGAFP